MLRRYQLLLQETLAEAIAWRICLFKCGSLKFHFGLDSALELLIDWRLNLNRNSL